ncbi:MAG: hypothetical protein QM783_12665 [Phycisphaerales bacterium]
MAKRTQWLFQDAPNTAVITVRRVLSREDPITLVSHDDDGWQFLNTGGRRDPDMSDAAVVGLEEIVRLDPTIMQLAGMPVGWKVQRRNATSDWVPIAPPERSRSSKAKTTKKKAAKKAGKKSAAKKPMSKKPATKKRTARRSR